MSSFESFECDVLHSKRTVQISVEIRQFSLFSSVEGNFFYQFPEWLDGEKEYACVQISRGTELALGTV